MSPGLLAAGGKRDWNVATFIELFLEPLVEQYPDLAGLKQPLGELR